MARPKKRSRAKKPKIITDSLKRETRKAFAQIQEAQRDLDLKIKHLKRGLASHTFWRP